MFARTRRRDRAGVRGPLARFAVTGLLCVVAIGLGAVMVERQIAQRDADRHATVTARLAARGILEPNVTAALLRGEPAAIARMDRLVRTRLKGADIKRVKLWTADGRLLYSDLTHLIGRRYKLGATDLRSLRTGGLTTAATNLEESENRDERRFGSLQEVSLPFRSQAGEQLLFELYLGRSDIARSARHTFIAFLPVLLGALLLMQLGQLPLAYSMARRLVSGRREREALLVRTIDASETERRRIASDLHDGVVQSLVGTAYGLSAAATRAPADAAERQAMLDAATQTRGSIRELRSLLVDIYPPDLHRVGLASALSDLIASVRTEGLEASLRVPDELELPRETEALLYRAAHEAVRNVRAHSGASRVDLLVTLDAKQAGLDVSDDGVGFSAAVAHDAPESGHFGLRVLRDMARAAGGRLDVLSEPGGGTRVSMAVPVG